MLSNLTSSELYELLPHPAENNHYVTHRGEVDLLIVQNALILHFCYRLFKQNELN
jgi:hypothetical protein